jgi:AcrR family transcriptional regulator
MNGGQGSEDHAIYNQVFGDELDKAARKKLSIIDSAIKIISTKGIESCSFEKIGVDLGLTKANVAYYFDGKDDLLLTVSKWIAGHARHFASRLVTEEKDPRAMLRAYINATYRWLDEHPHHASVMIYFLSVCTTDRIYMELNQDIRRSAVERVYLLLRLICKRASSDRELQVLAGQISSLLVGSIVNAVTTDNRHLYNSKHTNLAVDSLLKAHC